MASNNSDGTTTPQLCQNGCGFFGHRATGNMCSKCYKDFLKVTEQKFESLAIDKPLNHTKSATSVVPLPPSSSSVVAGDTTTTTTTTTTTSGAGTSDACKKKNRCESCNKRVGLTGFKCRCGGSFCGVHRYPEEHGCAFDFKSLGRDQLAKQNPLCSGDKLLERA